MAVRLNKVAKELGVGISTLVDHLAKKGVTIEANPNTQISDEQHDILVSAFSKDKALREAADEKIAQGHNKSNKANKQTSVAIEGYGENSPKKEEPKKAEKPEKAEAKNVSSIKIVDKIDLDALNKKKAKPAEPKKPEAPAEKKAEKAALAPKAEPKKPEATPKPVVEAPKEEKTEKPAAVHVAEVKPAEEKKDGEDQSEEVFRLYTSAAPTSGLKVVDKIDLSSINQTTRPKKKSKEERKKEREDKMRQNGGGVQGNGDGKKKKRNRIGVERVDINAVAQQNNGSNGKNGNKNKNNNNSNNNNGNGKHNKKKNAPVKQEVSDEDVAKQVKETLARLTNKNKGNKSAKYRKDKRENARAEMEERLNEEAAESKILKLTEFVTANELATMMDVPVTKVIGTCMSVGIMVSINQRLDAETINLVAEEFGFTTEFVSAEVAEAVKEEEDREEDLVPRAPVVTVMGHVDHGKTSLLDYIRKSNVIAGEAGGITQHIGAYNVLLEDGRHITFLDTPGHEAFTAMRARGAQATDVAIIIIAADDSIMPTTREAIAHATAANVPMVFAINKIDKPGANPDKIKEDLANMNFLVEEWGGKYQSQDISAKKGIGVKELMEKVLLEAEMLDLKANPNRKATGTVIESALDKGRGYVSTVLVSNGTLKQGDIVLAGTSFGRVKAMFNERNSRINEAGPAVPAIILGLNGAPTAGDTFHVMESEQEARELANKREQLQREQGLRTTGMLTLEEIARRRALGEFHEMNLIVKGDVDGSVEALSDMFIKLSTEKVQVNIVSKGVGQISENDVTFAASSQAVIIGFQVRPSGAARKLAEQQGVNIRTYSVIYDAIEEVKSAMEGMLEKEVREQVTGLLEVRQVYHISKVGTVAGAYVVDGKVARSNKARLIRDGIVIFTGEINALKRFKDDVKEVSTNFECGISLVGYNDIQEGDNIETFEEIEVKQKL